jgi:hypothetical protein
VAEPAPRRPARPHEPTVKYTPNQAYNAAAAYAGSIALPLTTDEYIDLLPVEYRVIGKTGIQIDNRIYDCDELNNYRGKPSHSPAHNNDWEVRYNPYDVMHVWVRTPEGDWIECPWRETESIAKPMFAEITANRRIEARNDLARQEAALMGTPMPLGTSVEEPEPEPVVSFTPAQTQRQHQQLGSRRPQRGVRTMSQPMFRTEPRLGPLYTKEGMTQRMSAVAIPPCPLTRAEYNTLSTLERASWNRERVTHLTKGIVINTPQVQQAKKDLKRLIASNLSDTGGYTGLVFSGAASLGKTTTCTHLMRYVFNQYGKQFPGFEAAGHVPVVYIIVPNGCTPKSLMVEFAKFFGMTVATQETAASIKHRVVQCLQKAQSALIVVDELHNLRPANRGNGEAINVLKQLHDEVPATFVYAGVELGDGVLLAGSLGEQLTSRFISTELTRYNLSDIEQAGDWYNIVAQFERSLPLLDHVQGTLTEHAMYLAARTGSSIGSLARIVNGIAIDLIEEPEGRPEAVTKRVLDAFKLDMAAEAAYKKLMLASKKQKAAA